jgi:hypothetical protein
MVEVEVRAAQNVLEACAQTDAMERVVFTSSVTAVIWKDDHKLVDAFDERNWSDLNFCRNKKVIPLEAREYSVEEEAVLRYEIQHTERKRATKPQETKQITACKSSRSFPGVACYVQKLCFPIRSRKVYYYVVPQFNRLG